MQIPSVRTSFQWREAAGRVLEGAGQRPDVLGTSGCSAGRSRRPDLLGGMAAARDARWARGRGAVLRQPRRLTVFLVPPPAYPPLVVADAPLGVLSASIDKTMCLWRPDADSGLWLPETRVGEMGGQNVLGFYGGVFSSDGRTMLAHGFNGSFHRWTTDDQRTDAAGAGLRWRPVPNWSLRTTKWMVRFSGLALDAGSCLQRARFSRSGPGLGSHGPLPGVGQVRLNPRTLPLQIDPLTAAFPCIFDLGN